MKIQIAADMEGITGVVHWDQVSSNSPDYPRFQVLMTADVNAAVRAAFEGGAEDVIVTDGHANGRNILIEELDPRARLNSGSPSPLAMVEGIGNDVVGVVFVGYHARVGTPNAILEHTWSSRTVSNVWVNNLPYGEIGLNAAVCGHFGVPVIMITGDQSACTEAEQLLGPIEKAIVKRAQGRMAAECLHPEVAQGKIYSAAKNAVSRLKAGHAPGPLLVETPIRLAVEFTTSEMADRASQLPGALRSARKIEYTADDMLTTYAAFQSLVGISSG